MPSSYAHEYSESFKSIFMFSYIFGEYICEMEIRFAYRNVEALTNGSHFAQTNEIHVVAYLLWGSDFRIARITLNCSLCSVFAIK